MREKSALYEALACTDSISLLDKYLDISIDPNSTIRSLFYEKLRGYKAVPESNSCLIANNRRKWLKTPHTHERRTLDEFMENMFYFFGP